MINMIKYVQNKNIVNVSNNLDAINLEFFSNGTIRIFKEKNSTKLYELAFPKKFLKFNVSQNNNEIAIEYLNYRFILNEKLEIKVENSNDIILNIDFSTKFCDVEKRNYYSTVLNINEDSYVFGLGDKMGFLDKKGYYYESHSTDDPTHQDELYPALYKSINYILFENNKHYFSIFLPSTFRYTFDVCKTNLDKVIINNFDSANDLFLFLGNNPKEVTRIYSDLVGHPYFISLKTLGYHQSRWSYENEEMVMDVYNKFKQYNLPLDYIHLDIHYMDGYRDFTYDKNRFSNLKNLTDFLKKDNVGIIAINDAAIKVDDNFDIYRYIIDNKLVGTLKNKPYVNVVWPGDSVFPSYIDPKCRVYFENKASDFIKETGISGIWNDMNEPASFKGELPNNVIFKNGNKKITHAEIHNIYAEHMVKCFTNVFKKDNLRPFNFSRAGFATTSKYAFCWNGDNFSLWHHLKYSITQSLSLSLSNFMYNGDDIGGFGGDSNKELLLRWLEANLFLPFLRNHSTLNSKHQEPYAFDEYTIKTYKKFLDIRYKFIPYLYDLAYRMNKYGKLMSRPLFYNYPFDKECLKINDQYMVGDNLLVAPIIDKSMTTRAVYLPEGYWINYFTNEEFKGNQYIICNANLDESIYFIKKDSIIVNYENLLHINKKEITELVIHLYGDKGEYINYEDDGESLNYENDEYNLYKIRFNKNKFNLITIHQKYTSNYKTIKIIKDGKEKVIPFDYKININLEDL